MASLPMAITLTCASGISTIDVSLGESRLRATSQSTIETKCLKVESKGAQSPICALRSGVAGVAHR